MEIKQKSPGFSKSFRALLVKSNAKTVHYVQINKNEMSENYSTGK